MMLPCFWLENDDSPYSVYDVDGLAQNPYKPCCPYHAKLDRLWTLAHPAYSAYSYESESDGYPDSDSDLEEINHRLYWELAQVARPSASNEVSYLPTEEFHRALYSSLKRNLKAKEVECHKTYKKFTEFLN